MARDDVFAQTFAMQLTAYGDYALRSLIYLAVQPDDRLVTVGDVSHA